MFSRLGQIAQKYRFIIIAGWVVLTAILALTAPKLSEVGVTDQSQFLPANTESAHVRDLLNTKFSSIDQSSSSALIVVYNEKGLSQLDMDRAKSIRDWLISPNAPEAINSVISIFDNNALRSSLVSLDNTTMLITVDMTVSALDNAAKQAVDEIRAQFTQQSGTTFYLTGSVGLLNDLFNSVQSTISQTTWVTIILVVILLLIIYPWNSWLFGRSRVKCFHGYRCLYGGHHFRGRYGLLSLYYLQVPGRTASGRPSTHDRIHIETHRPGYYCQRRHGYNCLPLSQHFTFRHDQDFRLGIGNRYSGHTYRRIDSGTGFNVSLRTLPFLAVDVRPG
jgi:hypothetical protein